MSGGPARRARILAGLALAAASLPVLAVAAWVTAAQLAWPFELSQLEGALVDHVRRAAEGKSIYGPPSAAFVPLLYTPLSEWAAAPLVRLGLHGFQAARLVSLASVAGAMLCGMVLVRRAGTRRAWALAVPLLAAAHLFDVQCFFDQARPDDLMSLFWMLAVLAGALDSERRAALLFGVFGALAILAKQSAAVMLALHLALLFALRPRLALLSAGALALATSVSFLVLDRATGGWLSAYALAAPAHHGFDRAALILSASRDFLGAFAPASAAACIVILSLVARGRPRELWADGRARARLSLLLATISSLGFAAVSISQPTAVKNVFVPFALAASACLPCALEWGVEALSGAGDARREALEPCAILLLALAVAHGLHDPRPFLPRAEDRATWIALRETVRARGGPANAWITLHGSAFGDRPGDPTAATSGELWDWVGGRFGGRTGNAVPDDLMAKLERREFSLILVPDWDEPTKRLIERWYEPDSSLGEVRLPAFTSGYPPKPERWWVPRSGG